MMGIDEASLAWFYIEPGYEKNETSQRLVHLALDLIGPNAWAVVQMAGENAHTLFDEGALDVVETYADATDNPSAINVHLARTR